MGVAALMIYFAHFYAYADLGLLNKLFAYGNWGVDVFLLLSGFGMCHSMSKSSSFSKGLDRALRVKLDADTYARLSDEFKTLCLGHIEQ